MELSFEQVSLMSQTSVVMLLAAVLDLRKTLLQEVSVIPGPRRGWVLFSGAVCLGCTAAVTVLGPLVGQGGLDGSAAFWFRGAYLVGGAALALAAAAHLVSSMSMVEPVSASKSPGPGRRRSRRRGR